MSNQTRKTYSWTSIVILLIIFWPIGLIMLFSKLSNDRTASFGGGSGIIKFIGVVLVAFGVIFLFTLASGDASIATTGIVLAAIFAVPGFYLIKKSNQVKNSGTKNRKYIDYIVNNQIHDIHELARRMNVSQEVVIEDVNGMINRGMLGGARLNLKEGVIQFPRPKPREEQPRPVTPSTPHRDQRPMHREPVQEFKQFEPQTIRCTSCSANNFVESLPATCEYCGTSLHKK